MEEKSFSIHLRSKIYTLPSDFRSLTDINENIYIELIARGKYKIKSNVRENICQCFIDYLVYNEIPKINILNISEYDELSQEFEIMENIILLYKKYVIHKPISQLFFSNQELKIKLKTIQSNLSIQNSNYQKIIQFLLDNDKISPNSFPNPSLRLMLYKSCLKERVEFVDLLTRKILIKNGLAFSLNEEEKTAGIVGYYSPSDYVVSIPKTIISESQEYMVTIIHKKAFKKSKISQVKFEEGSVLKIIDDKAFTFSSLFSIKIPKHVTRIGMKAFFCCSKLLSFVFSDDSELKTIEEDAFGNSQLSTLEFPSSVEEINDCFCSSNPRVTDLQVSGSPFFKNYSDQFLLGKTNPNRSQFDSLISYNGFYEENKIPPFIKRIAPSAFYGVEILERITFPEDSKLESIGSYSFGHCSIKSISIPSRVTIIEEGAFFDCEQLEEVTFSEDSKLLTIEKKAFCDTGIQSLSIPSSIIELKSGWCAFTPILTDVKISPSSSNYSYFDNGIILGKSETSGDLYDTIVFARRNIKKVKIPSFIKKIAAYAFCQCKYLKSVGFSENSELEIIEKNGLSHISINSISIPKHVKEIGSMALYSDLNLRQVEFDENSDLRLIKKLAFYQTSIERILLPASLKRIENSAFNFCQKLRIVDLANDSQLKFIGKESFCYSKIESFSIPSSVNEIEENAFSGCFNLQIIEINQNSPLDAIRLDWFENSPNIVLFVPFIHTINHQW